MNPLVGMIEPANAVAASRLADPDDLAAIRASGAAIVEVPHIGCRPVDDGIPRSLVRIRHWPNIGGYLERGDPDDIVAWAPYLAESPIEGRVLQIGPPDNGERPKRLQFLHRLIKRLEQHQGVVATHRPRSARTIVYTPGVPNDMLMPISQQFPHAVEPVPERLTEFPGGLVLTVTSGVWTDPEGFARSLDETLRESIASTSPARARAT